MSLRDCKMAVLRQLDLESKPISLLELMPKLDGQFGEHSVSRWLDP
jgi:hypothetical protein